jgi:hypothetical protein
MRWPGVCPDDAWANAADEPPVNATIVAEINRAFLMVAP